MVWQTIYFNKIFKKEIMIEAIAYAFKTSKEKIIIVSDITSLKEDDVEKKILCQSYILDRNEFKLRLDFSFDNDFEPENDIIIYSKLIERLNCRLLVDNYTIIPDTMLAIESIHINDDDFDDTQEYSLG